MPEVASRRHTELLPTVVAEALDVAGAGWDDVAAVAATVGPGLIGALLVGLAAAKAFAYARRLPLIPVDHLQGHIAANYALGAEPPFVCLVASGGHTLLAVVDEGVKFRVAGRTMDDAAGEAFDKGARLLGLGYPGGKELDELAARGQGRLRRLPARRPARPRLQLQRPQDGAALRPARARPGRDRGAPRRHRRELSGGDRPPARRQDRGAAPPARACAASPSPAASPPTPACARAMQRRCEREGLELFLPPLGLCTDNAAMIGLAAAHLPLVPWPRYLALDAYAQREPAPRREGLQRRLL